MIVLHVFRASVCDAGKGWVAHKWQFQRDVINEKPMLESSGPFTIKRCTVRVYPDAYVQVLQQIFIHLQRPSGYFMINLLFAMVNGRWHWWH